MSQHPFHPIIYLRGFAGTQGEIEETVADPYMGFNLGSTKTRQVWTGELRKFFFESPLVRLLKEHDYDDVYVDGVDQVLEASAAEPVPYRAIVVHRYYEQASRQLGTGTLPEMDDYARGLSKLILRLRDRVCANRANRVTPAGFRVHLVAHSMGGLICRALLQNRGNPRYGDDAARNAVDKVFTYGTPHNGIDFRLLGNIPKWLSFHNTNDFNRDRMAEYLGLDPAQAAAGDVSLVTHFDPDRLFNLVGTNAGDYAVAMGLTKALAGELSDGLVQIRNATTHGSWRGRHVNSPRAFVHRSHSGHYGLVNSEEGYQNLTRFLFGDIRVDAVLEIRDLSLPEALEKARTAGRRIRASYHFEVIVSVRGLPVQLHRRTTAENCAVFRTYDELFPADPARAARAPHLFSLFLDTHKIFASRRRSVGFAVELRVLVPDYEVDGLLIFDDHYEGGYLFRDRLIFEATPPRRAGGPWAVRYGFESQTPGRAPHPASLEPTPEGICFRVPIKQPNRPGIEAELKLCARPWS